MTKWKIKQIKPKHKGNLLCVGCEWALSRTEPTTTCPFVNSCEKTKKVIIVEVKDGTYDKNG